MALALLALVVSGGSWATQASPLPSPITLDQAEGGSLLLTTDHEGLYVPAPILDTQVEIHATGIVARTRIKQRFWNRTAYWVEGLYVFPLPENAAVDSLRMKIGDRTVVGEIQERAQARETYEAAKAAGQHASLVEQQRPNLFTTAVANLGPEEVVEVEIEFQQEITYQGGIFTLRFPTTAMPRYSPQAGPGSGGQGSNGRSRQDREAAPAIVTSEQAPNPFSLTVWLAPGFELERLDSPSHALVRESSDGSLSHRVEIAGPVVKADRDFILEWQPRAGEAPEAGLFVESHNDADYALLMVMPPAELAAQKLDLPREVVFVIDTSGSMAGESIQAAKEALLLALGRLEPKDSFNVIEFNSLVRKLFPGSMPATYGNRALARVFVSALDANGGTEMGKALEAALESPAVAASELRQVIFITDGAVANEAALFSYLNDHLGTNRLFTVAIGSAPNTHFMTRAAELGRGTFTSIPNPRLVMWGMSALFAQLERPVATDLEVVWDDPAVVSYPSRVPDLYSGQPILLAARLERGDRTHFTLRGKTGDVPWERRLSALPTAPSGGLDKLWARRRVDELERDLANGADPVATEASLVELGKTFHLVTRVTSLVAVDTTPARPAGERYATTRIPVTPPAGWQPRSVFGELPAGGTSARLDLALGLILILLAILTVPALDGWGRSGAQ